MLSNAKHQHLTAIDGIERLQDQLTFRVSVLSKLLDRQMSDIALRQDLSLLEYRLLATIEAFGTLTAADLVRYTGYDKAAVSRAISGLTSQNLIDVKTDPEHGRRKLLSLSELGAGKLAAAAPDVEARRQKLVAQLSRAEEQVFRSAIEKLAAFVADDLAQTSTDKT